jgi:hypothetical protein
MVLPQALLGAFVLVIGGVLITRRDVPGWLWAGIAFFLVVQVVLTLALAQPAGGSGVAIAIIALGLALLAAGAFVVRAGLGRDGVLGVAAMVVMTVLGAACGLLLVGGTLAGLIGQFGGPPVLASVVAVPAAVLGARNGWRWAADRRAGHIPA